MIVQSPSVVTYAFELREAKIMRGLSTDLVNLNNIGVQCTRYKSCTLQVLKSFQSKLPIKEPIFGGQRSLYHAAILPVIQYEMLVHGIISHHLLHVFQ